MSTSLNIETVETGNPRTSPKPVKMATNRPLTLFSCLLLSIGLLGGPLLIRLYYLHGGNRRWIPPFMQTAGFPILLLPLTVLLLRSKPQKGSQLPPSKLLLDTRLYILGAVVGVCIGLVNFLYSLGISYLPVSTSLILFNTQLAFIAVFARLIVKHKFTPYSFNAVVLMTLGSILLGVGSSGDRPAGVSNSQYLAGFFLTLGAAAGIGITFPCIEFFYSKSARTMNYIMFLQFQFTLTACATIFNVIGMLINKDFQAMGRDSKQYDLGHGAYFLVLVGIAVVWQISFLGGFGLIFFSSSLFSGIMTAVILPLAEVAAVIAFHESFNGAKGISLALCLWGFVSYFYGEHRTSKKVKNAAQQSDSDSAIDH